MIFRVISLSLLVVIGQPAAGARVADEVMVRFKPGTPASAAIGAIRGIGAVRKGEVAALRIKLVKLPPGLPVQTAIDRLMRNPNVEAVEPNMRLYPKGLPDDPLLSQQWGLEQIRAVLAWGMTVTGARGSPGVVIAVVDTGVLSTHPDLAGKIVPGYNSYDDTANTEPGVGPGWFHGTAVASVAAGATDNSKGIAGVAWDCRIMPIRISGTSANDMTEWRAIVGLVWAVDHGARVINMSLGSCMLDPVSGLIECGSGSSSGAAAMNYAFARGAVVIASAGNEATSLESYPAAYPNVMAVSATTRNDQIAGYSNWGIYVDVAAPGGLATAPCTAADDILVATSEAGGCPGYGASPNDYRTTAGTSFAAPHAAGLAAVLFGQNPSRSNAQVIGLIQSTADQPARVPLPSLDWSRTYNSPSNDEDWANAVGIDASGNIIVAGSEKRLDLVETNNWLIKKYDSAGNVVWSRTYNSAPNKDDAANALAVDSGGAFAVAGYASPVMLQTKDWLVRKYDSAGVVVWGKAYSGPTAGADEALGVAVDSGGNVIAVGYHGTPTDGDDWLIRKYDGVGTLVWSRTYGYGGSGNDHATGVAADLDGNVVVAGYEDASAAGESFNWHIRKYDSAGALLWTAGHNGIADGMDAANGVAVDAARNIVVVGYETGPAGQGYNWLVRKYTSAGILLWSRGYNSVINGNDYAYGVAVDGGGNILVAGAEDRSDVGQSINMLVRKYDRTGTLLWSKGYNSPGNGWDDAGAIAVRGDVTAVAGIENRTDIAEGVNWSIHKYVGGDLGWNSWNDYYGHGRINMYKALTEPDPVPSISGGLSSALVVAPSPAGAGRPFSVALAVNNTGADIVTDIVPSLAVTSGGTVVSAPVAPSLLTVETLVGGTAKVYVWSYLALASGTVAFTALTTGVDTDTGGLISTTARATLDILAAPESANEFMVYPNPVAGDTLKISIPLSEDAAEVVLRVYNAASMKLVTKGVWRDMVQGEGGVILDGVSAWAPGMYLVRVQVKLRSGHARTFPTVKLMVKR